MNFPRHLGYPRFLILCLSCLLASSLFAQTEFDQYISETAQRWKSSRQAILDDAGMVAAGTRRELEDHLVRFERETGIAVAVVTLPSMKGGQLEDFTNRLYEQVGLGKTGQDSGVMLLVAKQERKIRIETGYGEEGALTDLEAKLIIDGIITPAFKSGNFSRGIENGVKAILNEVQPGFVPAPASRALSRKSSDWIGNIFIVVILMIIFVLRFINPFGRRRYRRRGIWVGGSGGFGSSSGFGGGGGGFGGFGGGMSGGGGGSGGW